MFEDSEEKPECEQDTKNLYHKLVKLEYAVLTVVWEEVMEYFNKTRETLITGRMPKSVYLYDEDSTDLEARKVERALLEDVTDSFESEFSPLSRTDVAGKSFEVKGLQTEEGKQKRSFASAAGDRTRQLSTKKSDVLMYKDMIKIQDGVVKVQTAEELLLTVKKKTIMFKTYC
ncbi:Hypothetical predicted protein [Octopus vulgaris]|uniref:Uncharacterized protein n=1 Tax=Octopus vulgaris TaxID=6645 RepID=A0AA36F4P1_OCTVU|nr:Hypothetical predicted protein [Octopus vulgaris]